LAKTPETQEIKAKIGKWNYIKLKSFCSSKDTVNRVKRQPIQWKNIFSNYTCDKGNPKYMRNSKFSIAGPGMVI
jgi:hypothetical protein